MFLVNFFSQWLSRIIYPFNLSCHLLIPLYKEVRGVARGGEGAEGARAPPEFGRSVNPIQIRGADYAPHTTSSPPGFKKLSTPLEVNRKSHFKRLLNTYLTRFLDNWDGKDGFLLIYISNHLAYAVLKSSQVPIQTLLPLFFSLSHFKITLVYSTFLLLKTLQFSYFRFLPFPPSLLTQLSLPGAIMGE